MKKKQLFKGFLLFMLLVVSGITAQKTIDETLKSLNDGSVPYLTVQELRTQTGAILLDTRSWEEYRVSHLHNAIWVGYKEFEIGKILEQVPDKDSPVVVYCSVGVRSEDIGEKLRENGYTNVRNLYGGIFEWKNTGGVVYDMEGAETNKVHAYNKRWGKLLNSGEKVY